VTLPKGIKSENLYKTIELHADMMLNPIFPDEELGLPFDLEEGNKGPKRERNVVIEEINMRNDQPWSKVYNLMNKNMYTSHPYKRDVIGTPEIIASVPRETIDMYYKKYYSPNNMVTIVVGDFDNEDVLEHVIKEFDFKGREQTPQTQYDLDTPPVQTRYEEMKAVINTGFMIFGYLGPAARDLRGTIIMDMLNIILGEGQSSRLYKHLIERTAEPIFNIIATDYYCFKDGGNFLIQGNFRPEFKDDAINLIKNEINSLIQNGIEPVEFNKAKKKIKSRFAESAETVSDIADTIGHYVIVSQDLNLANEYLKVLDSITAEDVKNAAKDYLDTNKATIAVLIPEAQ